MSLSTAQDGNIQIIVTGDGSHSLLNTFLQETYHSKHGALRESEHVFIRHGLSYAAENNFLTSLQILEVGFGTGLNALLTVNHCRKLRSVVHYTTIEAYPLTEEVWRHLNYASHMEEGSASTFEQLHAVAWNEEISVDPFFTLLKSSTPVEDVHLTTASYDLIYYDAFAPNKQPEMWTQAILSKVCEAMKPGGVFVTYCAKGQVKRDLKALGLTVETLDGPPGKKEMIRGVKV